MIAKLDYEGHSELKTYVCLTNAYAIVGRAEASNVVDFLKERLSFPVVETTIGNIKSVGVQCVGNKYGLVCSQNINDHELMHIRNSLPKEIAVARIYDKLNALGNNILCNDHICIVNPEFKATDELEQILKVPVVKMSLGKLPLVGTFGVMNNKGILVHPQMNENEIREISEMVKLDAIASTINKGRNEIGSGIIANDFIVIVGRRSTNIELKVASKVLGIDEDIDENALKEEIVH